MTGKATARPGKIRDGLKCVPSVSLPLNRLGLNSVFVQNRPMILCLLAVCGRDCRKSMERSSLFLREILAFNDLKEKAPLEPGTMVYIRPKKKYAAKGLEKFIVGEEPVTLRDICQRFAVKMPSIVKLNGLAADYVPAEGDTILLRKPKKLK